KANALGNIAGGMYNVGQDYGSAGLGMYGAQQGYSGGAFTSQNNTASDNASTVQSGAISIGRDENNDIQTTTSGGLSSLPTVSSRNEGFALG
ncbi:MAG: hypothetical protein JW925_12580, partial [Syntrophaceae bacterium]|nr:hypothetical protein [Syntrophaceae bacterium]